MFNVNVWVALVAILTCSLVLDAKILTPPYFNLAEGRNITASATCGEDTNGPELYCKLVGANAENDLQVHVIQGQYCDYCDPTNPDKMHPPRFAVDGMESWWQSPPLSRGMKYNEVNLTIDLGQEFHVAYIYMRMGNSPRPGLWILEKSADYGQTYVPWQYFSDSEADCETHFGSESLQPITKDDSVVCSTEYSKIVPLEGGEIPISLLNNRPSANHYFNSSILQEWTRATNVRFRFLRTKNLLGHLMSVARQDPTVTRRYFYSIKDISIGGRCMCNGHADTCDIQDAANPHVLLCRCQHNTCGAKCETCCSGYQQKAWKQSKSYKPFICEPCNCFEHSNECLYDAEIDQQHLSLDIHGNYEGGGVCKNCRHNTEGINCNKCQPKFFRPGNKYWNETDVCQPCRCDDFFSTGNCEEVTGICECRKQFTSPDCKSCSYGYYDYPNCKACECYLDGTESLQCEPDNGQCHCKYNYGGEYCKQCADQYYNFPECKPCECNTLGSTSSICDQESGNCTCKNNYAGKQCDECKNGYYSYPSCTFCSCDTGGTIPEICDKLSGKCLCKQGYGGDRCDECISGYYGYPDCKPCNCSLIGSASAVCDIGGSCRCLDNFGGRTCEKCSVGYYQFPECLACNCDSHGSDGTSCDHNGQCQCNYNFDGNQCNACKEGFYNFPSCEECNCNPAGVVAAFAGCGSVPAGELCRCKERVEGRICNKCKPLYWNLHLNNPEGCEECQCNPAGVLGGIGVCDSESGQCVCKPSVVARGCSECSDGTFNLQESNLFGCIDCGCDIGGSISPVCHKISGQCPCHSRVTGKTCKDPLQAHYFPTLYQYQYEVEDGHTPAYTPVRYAYDETVFPGYSWKGYAVFSQLQNEILQDIYIYKPSLYRMVIRYINLNYELVTGTIKITPETPSDNEQSINVQFKTSTVPTYVTVSGAGNALVINPGRWTVSIQSNQNLFVDYFVLLPEDFYLATILNQKVEQPCVIGQNILCRDYSYPNTSSFDLSWGSGGYVNIGDSIDSVREFYDNYEHLHQLQISNRIPLLNKAQPDITYNITVRKPGRYVIVIDYITPLDDQTTHEIIVNTVAQNGKKTSRVILYSCPYTTACRQIVTDKQSNVGVHLVDGNLISVHLQGVNANVGIHSVVAIPIEEWSLDFIKPKPVCIRRDKECISSTYPNSPESKRVPFKQNGSTEGSPYFHLSRQEDMVDLQGKVNEPGSYVLIVQYFQPEFSEFYLDVIVHNGKFYEAKLLIKHCPSKSGCRSLIVENGGNIKYVFTENFVVSVKGSSRKGVFLDYLLMVPSDFYTATILEEDNLDRTGEFIATCGSNHFNIDTTHQGFCRDSVFSITAAHNNGALPCQCDYDGSLSFECNKFGGQCDCKDNVIGQRCEACKTGYYGFPDCKQCHCPSTALCETSTGRCICPTNVVGELCDKCENYTYGYDPIIGCERCECDALGVDKTLECNLYNGSCSCKKHIVGRKCDSCEAGYFVFPHCEPCECDLRGTTDKICDQASAECFCKKFVTGPICNFCKEGSFNLQSSNNEGCTECFCFGKTSRCISSNFVQVSFTIMEDWKLVAINESLKLEVLPLNMTIDEVEKGTTIGADFTRENVSNHVVYFAAPDAYLGTKITAYGGFLNYTIFYTIGTTGKALPRSDVILEGNGTYLVYVGDEQPPPSIEYMASLQLVESNFQLPNGNQARREHIMVVLQNLRGLYIRSTYWTESVTTKLLHVHMDDSIPRKYLHSNATSVVYALSVEQCQCPPGYDGLSCEYCSAGYYRIDSGPHGGYCVPCQCNGHATDCDVNTGKCFDCRHNTRGDHCNECAVGYHGNALQGTPGDCLICACPLPVPSNNFANSCELSSDGEKISCECNAGYVGYQCQACGPGFYGRPDNLGDYCKPCRCSGNINTTEHGSCDTVSGDCLRCLYNTYGEACSLCAPGFYGDAIQAKNCQPCICDRVGTQYCNHTTGLCECKVNVTGEKCDRCEFEHYGFNSGNGCTSCNCGLASLSSQCDDETGQCRCKPGVAGRTCNVCAPGYWKYSEQGCESCGCNTEYSRGFGCNAQTGHCECLPGVVGEKCDQCPHRWAFVANVGCHECDKCTHGLLNDTDELHNLIYPYILEFDSVDSGYFTTQRLAHINNTLNELKPKVKLLNQSSFDLAPLMQQVKVLQLDSENLNRNSNYSNTNSKKLSLSSENTREEAIIVLDSIKEAAEEAAETIANVDFLAESLSAGEGPKIDAALQTAQDILSQIKIYNLTNRENEAVKQLQKAETILQSLNEMKKPAQVVDSKFGDLKDQLKQFNDKVEDLYSHTQYALNQANEAEELYDKSEKDKVLNKVENIKNQKNQIGRDLENSTVNLVNATRYLNEAQKLFNGTSNDYKVFEIKNNDFNNTLEKNFEELTIVMDLLPQVQDHATNLSAHAEQLDNLLTESRNVSINAVAAAQAYKNIVDAVDDAENAANSAKVNAKNAATLLSEVAEDTVSANDVSVNLLSSANNETANNLTLRLEEANAKNRPIRSLHLKNEEILKSIENFFKQPQKPSLHNQLLAALSALESVNNSAKILEIAHNNFKNLAEEKESSVDLPNTLEDTKRHINQAKQQIQTVNDNLPIIERTLQELPPRQERVRLISNSLKDKINILNQQIAVARDVANRIKLGLKFYPNTTLELRNPPNLADLSTSTYISGYFKTNSSNGLLLYLGNGKGTNLRRTNSDDYLALEVENSYLVLTIDVGNGPQRVVNLKHIDSNTWYQFIIDRSAHNAKLIVREEISGGEDHLTTATEELQGHNTIFNLDRNQSKLFVGGYPPQFPIQSQVRQNAFDGEIEELVIGEIPISLWNFREGHENNHGAARRDKLVNLQPSTGYRFNGNGYAIIDARSFSLKGRSDIQLSFNTFSPDGLLFLVKSEGSNKFTSLELRDGRVLYQYNLGGETKKWFTPKLYNDGKWHVIGASRFGPKGALIVDKESIKDDSNVVTGNSIESFETFFFGGYPQQHTIKDVTNEDFDGCIDIVTFMGTPIDLSQNVKAYGVTPGCPEKFARLISFSDKKIGYIKSGNFSSGQLFQMNLKFKTKSNEGLILFATDQYFSNGVSLSIVGGKLVLISQKIQLETDDSAYNDNEWHVVSIIHNSTTLRFDIDDYVSKVTDSPPPPMYVMYGAIYFGGLPVTHANIKGLVGTTKNFSGCIVDASKNGAIINFASYAEKEGEFLGKCVLDEIIGSETNVHAVPTLPPIHEIEPITPTLSTAKTKEPYEAGIPQRGDGGRESAGEVETTAINIPQEVPPFTEKPSVKQPPVTPSVKQPPVITVTKQPVIPQVKQPIKAGKTEPSCALPMQPAMDVANSGKSFKYGLEPYSRSEYNTARGKTRKQFDFTLDFKTTANQGILLFASNPTNVHYVAVYLQDGHVIFTFNGGSGEAVMTSDLTYNDGNWHSVNISRNGAEGQLEIDDKIVAVGKAPKNTANAQLAPPFYIGSVSREKNIQIKSILNISATFDGCISSFHMNGFVMDDPKHFDVMPCMDNVEQGAFFGIFGGYVRLKDRFRVGYEIDIRLEIKPRNVSGLLVAVHGKRDYLVLEMVNGVIKLTADNGKGAISTSFQPDKPHYFCDGHWHTIQAVKSKNVVTLSVDSTYTDPGVGDYRSQSTDTGGALFLGGHRLIAKARGLNIRSSFVGCIRKVAINNDLIPLTQDMAEGHVNVGSCPTV